MKYRHTIVLEFDTPETDRKYSAHMKAMGGNVVAVAFSDALEELSAAQEDAVKFASQWTEATEALAQREEELAAERRKNRELNFAIGRAREESDDAAVVIDRLRTVLAGITL